MAAIVQKGLHCLTRRCAEGGGGSVVKVKHVGEVANPRQREVVRGNHPRRVREGLPNCDSVTDPGYFCISAFMAEPIAPMPLSTLGRPFMAPAKSARLEMW